MVSAVSGCWRVHLYFRLSKWGLSFRLDTAHGARGHLAGLERAGNRPAGAVRLLGGAENPLAQVHTAGVFTVQDHEKGV